MTDDRLIRNHPLFTTPSMGRDDFNRSERQPLQRDIFMRDDHEILKPYLPPGKLFKNNRVWQPIETAPKDGTIVLGYCPESVSAGETDQELWPEGLKILPMRWAALEDGFDWQIPYSEYSSPMFDDLGPSWGRLDWKPTHWQPLPPPPED